MSTLAFAVHDILLVCFTVVAYGLGRWWAQRDLRTAARRMNECLHEDIRLVQPFPHVVMRCAQCRAVLRWQPRTEELRDGLAPVAVAILAPRPKGAPPS